jgi:DNA-directed RNA polymerase specialized sigma subunit
MRSLRDRHAREVPMEEARRAADRACLDELGAGIDPDVYDAYEDTSDDFGRAARELADEGMLALALERRLAQIVAELPNLSPLAQRLLRMRFQERQTLDAIALATEIPRTNVFRMLAKALGELRRRLDENERREQ